MTIPKSNLARKRLRAILLHLRSTLGCFEEHLADLEAAYADEEEGTADVALTQLTVLAFEVGNDLRNANHLARGWAEPEYIVTDYDDEGDHFAWVRQRSRDMKTGTGGCGGRR